MELELHFADELTEAKGASLRARAAASRVSQTAHGVPVCPPQALDQGLVGVARHLLLYSLSAQNGFYIFKSLHFKIVT